MAVAFFGGLIGERYGVFNGNYFDFTLPRYYKITLLFLLLIVYFWPQKDEIKKKKEMSFDRKRAFMVFFATVIIVLVGLEYGGILITSPLTISVSRLIIGICAFGFLLVMPTLEKLHLESIKKNEVSSKPREKRSNKLFFSLVFSILTFVLYMQNMLDNITNIIVWVAVYGVLMLLTVRNLASVEKLSDELEEKKENNEGSKGSY
jgi:hypothetical protein